MPARVQSTVEVEDLSRLPSAEKIVPVSDGLMPLMTGMTAFAWVLTNEGKSAHVTGVKNIWTNPLHMTSYRAKLAGIHNMLVCATQHCDLQTPLEVWCDNTSVLNMIHPQDEIPS